MLLSGTAADTFNLNGAIFGGQIGFNRQNGNWVWGLEVDVQWSGQNGDTAIHLFSVQVPVTYLTCGRGPRRRCRRHRSSRSLQWFVTLRGRLGVLVAPTWLAYVTGGFAIGHIETKGVLSGFTAASAPTSAAFGYDKTKLGWTVGGGVEGRISGNWTAKLEYIYADYGSVSGTGLLPTAVTAAARRVQLESNRSRPSRRRELQVGPDAGGRALLIRNATLRNAKAPLRKGRRFDFVGLREIARYRSEPPDYFPSCGAVD